ncbi:MAG: hypothetical protein ACE1Y2_05255 [Stenotrophomonas maltophilia]
MEIVSLVASAVSVLVALGAITISRIYYSRTSRLVHKHERMAHVLEKSVDQVYVMLNKLSLETEEAYGRIESGVSQLAEAAANVHTQESDPQEDLSAPPSMNGKKL